MKISFWSQRFLSSFLFFLLSACVVSPQYRQSVQGTPAAGTDILVRGTQWGVSTCYIGTVEGSSNFSLADIKDLGINSYRIYGGMSRWEPVDDSSVYGLPTIAQIKADPDVIDWSRWDAIMTNPPDNSDYWWVGGQHLWQGNARTLFSDLKAAGVRPILTLRNDDKPGNPSWAPDPPTAQADWNEWWEHVFATVYWLDVRNNYNVNDFEVHNEPNVKPMGWTGTEQQYVMLLQYTSDAIRYVYQTYLPGRTYHIYAPDTNTSSSWPNDMLRQASGLFDSMDIHDYSQNMSTYVQQVHGWMQNNGQRNMPLWISEWGSFSNSDKYNSVAMGVRMIDNLIRSSESGNDYVYGSTLFSLYDYGTTPFGLIGYDGTRRLDYYALRMAIQALQGCKPTYQTVLVNPSAYPGVRALTTDQHHTISVLVANQGTNVNYMMRLNLSALVSSGVATVSQFDQNHEDVVVSHSSLINGIVPILVPAQGALLVTLPD